MQAMAQGTFIGCFSAIEGVRCAGSKHGEAYELRARRGKRRRTTTRSLYEPDELEAVSINQILRKHSRDRLFVHPLRWTSQQVTLLECHFARKTVKVPPALHAQFPEPLRFAADRLWQACLAKKRILYDLLEDYNLRCHHSCSLPFRFGRQEVTRVATHGVFSPASSTGSTAPPNLACLELAAVQEQRNDSVSRRLENDLIAVSLQLKHQHRLRRTNKVEDPYIVATLVALAQEQHLQDSTRPTCEVRPTLLPHMPRLTAMGKGACHCYPISNIKELVFLHSLGPFLLDYITPLNNIPSLPSPSRISASSLNQQKRCYL